MQTKLLLITIFLVSIMTGLKAQDSYELTLGEGESAETVAKVSKEFGPWTSEAATIKLDKEEIAWRLKQDMKFMKTMADDPKSHIMQSEIEHLKALNTEHQIQLDYYSYGLQGPFAISQENMLEIWLKKINATPYGLRRYATEQEGSEFFFAAKGYGIIKEKNTTFFIVSLMKYNASNQVMLITFPSQKEEVAWEMVKNIGRFDWRTGKDVE